MKNLIVILSILFSFSALSGLGKKVEGKLISYNDKSFLISTAKGKKVRFLFKDTTLTNEPELSELLNKKISFVVPYEKAPK